MYNECLNCSAIWAPGSEEWDAQQCDACGWRPGMPVDKDVDDEWDIGAMDDNWDEEEDDDERYSPVDSRNL